MTDPELISWYPRVLAIAVAASGSDGAHDASHLHRVWRNAQALLIAFRAAFADEWAPASP